MYTHTFILQQHTSTVVTVWITIPLRVYVPLNRVNQSSHLISLRNRSLTQTDDEYPQHHVVPGLFSSSHIEYELSRDKVADPSMAEMVEVAINILQRDDDGFFLMVEGGCCTGLADGMNVSIGLLRHIYNG